MLSEIAVVVFNEQSGVIPALPLALSPMVSSESKPDK